MRNALQRVIRAVQNLNARNRTANCHDPNGHGPKEVTPRKAHTPGGRSLSRPESEQGRPARADRRERALTSDDRRVKWAAAGNSLLDALAYMNASNCNIMNPQCAFRGVYESLYGVDSFYCPFPALSCHQITPEMWKKVLHEGTCFQLVTKPPQEAPRHSSPSVHSPQHSRLRRSVLPLRLRLQRHYAKRLQRRFGAQGEEMTATYHINEPIEEAFRQLGNGDYTKGRHIVLTLANRLRHARAKHPAFVTPTVPYMDVFVSETREHLAELYGNNRPRACDEAYDVMAVLVRYLNDEDKKDGPKA